MSKHRTRGTRLSRLMSGVLCLALMLGMLPSAGLIQTAEAAYWADPYGEQLVEWGVMNPSSDLRLSSSITRAEFVAMCNRAFGYDKLGSMPFVDVPSSAWYAQDINIAYNAGYFNGTSSDPSRPTASPNGTLTREMAAVMVARNLMLQETVGEVQDFTDSHDLHEWSRGLIGAAVAEGMIGGYEDGSYRPARSITRGEVAKMLVSVIGNPINKAGSYELGGVYGNVTISSSNVTLRNTTIVGNLYVTGGVDLGNVLLENVTVLGRIVVAGGGESHSGQSSVVLRNVKADELVIDSMIDQFTTVSAYGITDIPVTYVRSDAYLEDESWPGYGLQYIELDGDPRTLLQLAGNIKEVLNKTPFSTLQLAQGTAEKITIDEYATNSELILDINTRVDELNLDVATLVHGQGDITDLNIWAADCDVEILPEHVNIRPGITATVDGEVIDHTGAAELSSEPRLLAGYPKVANLTPTQVEGQFSGNKQGTIYYAVSELADGSVSLEDLVNNPAYGGIIYEGNAGNIAASSKTVYSRDITKLQPDGSYYLTAMLEDGRGNQSPIKVVSFTTPDNTVPEFLNGRISRETCEVVQLTGMANKSCTLYWVLLASGADAPTAQNFKSGSFGGNYGNGSMSVAKNVPVSITVNTQRLQEDTNYVLYVWLNDFNGAQSSQVYKFDVHTPDETPPVVIEIMQTDYGETDAQVTFKINEYPSTLYWAVVPEAKADAFINPDTDPNDMRAQIKIESGATSLVHGSTPSRGANMDTDILKSVLKGLVDTHSFVMFYVATDAAGNYSEWGRLDIHTLDTDPPHAWLEFSDPVNGKPNANSDIRIVFDEQVKGGDNAAQTFLDIYQQVEDFAKLLETDPNNTTYQNNLTAAKNTLASELAAHFQLWYIPKNGTATQVNSLTASIGGTTGDWIYFNNAVITMENGNMVITLAGKDSDDGSVKQAINLQSGANYQFRLIGVYDDAFTANGVAVDENDVSVWPACVREGGKANDNGNGRLSFTTAYAQVVLSSNGNLTSITGEGGYAGTRLDIVVNVDPKSTSKMPDTEYWDMVIWTDTTVTFDMYRKVVDKNGNDITGQDWELVGTGISMTPGTNTEAISLNQRKSSTPQYETAKAGLDEAYIYIYGVHFTSVKGISEEYGLEGEELANARNNEPVAWSAEIALSFSLVAGNQDTLMRRFSGNIKSLYETHIASGDLSEIGDVNGAGEQSILVCHRTFSDTQPPSFQSGYPVITSGSGSITMEVGLDRPGTVYYVIAPASGANSITTRVDANNPVTNDNGGDNCNDGSNGTVSSPTYIPTGGGDGNISSAYFYNNKRYETPISDSIIDGTYTGRTGVITGSKYVNGTVETIFEPGLEAEKWYYVYIVLEGGGDPSKIVQIYRIKTDKIKPPVVVVSPAGGAGVDMDVYDVNDDGTQASTHYDNSLLFYALWDWEKLPPIFKTVYKWDAASGPAASNKTADAADADVTDGEMSVFAAMMTSVNSSGRTYFDEYATATMKTNVVGYIRGIGVTDSVNYVPTSRYYGQNGLAANTKGENFSEIMDDGAEYVVLVCARSSKGAETGDAYGFGSIRQLYKPDDVPPSFINTSDFDAYYQASAYAIDENGKEVPWEQWASKDSTALGYGYGGSVGISFTKELYVRIGTTRYELVYWNPNDPAAQKGIVTVVGGTAIANGHASVNQAGKNAGSAVGSSFTVTLNGIRNGETIEIFNTGRICNESNYASEYKLVLTFNPILKTSNYDKTVVNGAEMISPGFRVSWVKVTNG